MAKSESSENYLETIYILSNRLPVVRSIDVANELGYKKSSVSVAMKNLRQNKFITVSGEGWISLTSAGEKIAKMINERHEVFSTWLCSLGVNQETAAEDACKMEHVISHESFLAIKNYIKNQK